MVLSRAQIPSSCENRMEIDDPTCGRSPVEFLMEGLSDWYDAKEDGAWVLCKCYICRGCAMYWRKSESLIITPIDELVMNNG